MNRIRKRFLGTLVLLTTILSGIASSAPTAYSSLQGVSALDVAYDFRLTDPKTAALFFRLIHETYSDRDINQFEKSPRFVVVVNGAAVKLIAKNQPGYSAEDQEYIDEIAERISQMAADGIRFEGCLKAAEIFGVDPGLFLGDINKIKNAWISLAGYQAQQFSTLPIA